MQQADSKPHPQHPTFTSSLLSSILLISISLERSQALSEIKKKGDFKRKIEEN